LWDEADDFSSWGDDYGNPPLPTRFLIEMRWPSEAARVRAMTTRAAALSRADVCRTTARRTASHPVRPFSCWGSRAAC
jgi:hypothetical protein